MKSCFSKRFIAQVFQSVSKVTEQITPCSTIAVGGFGTAGVPENLLYSLSKSQSHSFNLISIDANIDNYGIDYLLANKQIAHMTAAYLGENSNLKNQWLEGGLQVELVPMGSLVEKLRCGGNGIGGFYAKAGVGTQLVSGLPKKWRGSEVEEWTQGREVREFDGEMYVFEKGLKADFGLIKAWKADKLGNLCYRGSARNSNPLVAMAAKTTLVEVEEIVEVGQLLPSEIHTPAAYVDKLVCPEFFRKPISRLRNKGSKTVNRDTASIIQRAAKEVKQGMVVNLGIGMPTQIPSFVQEPNVLIQAENGILGVGDYPFPGEEDPDFINAGKETVTLIKGGSLFDSSDSFAMIRGGHVDLTILGALEVSQKGDIASWLVPGKLVKGMGGAMDLVSSKSRKVVVMSHTASGKPKLLKECNYPLTGKGVDMVITDLGVFEWVEGEMALTELMPGKTLDEVFAYTPAKFKVVLGETALT